MSSREQILESIMNRKKYVAFTPFFTNYMGTRRNINMITLPEYSKNEIVKRVDTQGAIDFMEKIVAEQAKFTEELGETLLWTSISCEISYFVDSRMHTERNFRDGKICEGDMIRGINCVTIGYSVLKDGNEFLDRRSFIVDLDEFIKGLSALDYLPTFDPEDFGTRLLHRILEEGFEASPELNFTKNYKAKTRKASL